MIEDFATLLLRPTRWGDGTRTLNTWLPTARHCKEIDFAMAFHRLSASGLLCVNGVCSESLFRNQ
jgi:hypothetical protein